MVHVYNGIRLYSIYFSYFSLLFHDRVGFHNFLEILLPGRDNCWVIFGVVTPPIEPWHEICNTCTLMPVEWYSVKFIYS